MTTIKRPDLKPCPFCGEAPYYMLGEDRVKHCSTKWMPVNEWNRRPEEDRLKVALQRLLELDIHDPDLKDELWCIQQEEAPNL